MVLLIRHLESEKNVKNSFSSNLDNEKLTEFGEDEGKKLADNIYYYVKKNNFKISNVYCAKSTRAISTAKIIADKLNVKIEPFEDLKSNKAGLLKGKKEEEATSLNPTFMKQLKLFRAGVFSSYDFINLFEREDKHDFECRVNACLDSILSNSTEDLIIIVLHHSSLTAIAIRYARLFYSYPNNFYGHIACDLGNIYLIDSNGIIFCNESSSILLEL